MANKKVTGADVELQECGKAARGEYAHPATPFKEDDPRRAFGWSAVTDVIELRRLYDDLLLRFSKQGRELREAGDEVAALKRDLDSQTKKSAESVKEVDSLRDDRAELEGQVRDLIEAAGALGRAYTAVA